MRWRMQSKRYPAGQAWFWETTWVYGIGLIGYGVYLLLVWILSWLTGVFQVDLVLFHGLVWTFFVLAHLPDLLSVRDPEESQNLSAPAAKSSGEEPIVVTEMEPLVASGGETEGKTAVPRGCWYLVPALLIAAVNLVTATRSADLAAVLAPLLPRLDPGLLPALSHLAVVLSAYAVHSIVNLITLPVLRLATRPSIPRLPPPTQPVPDRKVRPVPIESAGAVPGARLLIRATTHTTRLSKIPLPTVLARTARGPLGRVVDHLKTVPENELKPVLRLISAVATGDMRRLETPLIADTTHHLLCHRDGSLDARLLAQFLQHLPRIREFVPRTAHGTHVYRPAARSLTSALAGIRIPAWKDWLTRPDPGLRQFAGCIQAARTDQPVVLLCLGAAHLPYGQTLKRILDHDLRQCALRHQVRVACGVVEHGAAGLRRSPGSGPTPAQDEMAAALVEVGIREPDDSPPTVDPAAAAKATVILLADPGAGPTVLVQWLAQNHQDAPVLEKAIPIEGLCPASLGQPPDAAGQDREPDLREWVRCVLATVTERILLVLQTKTGDLFPAFALPLEGFQPPPSSEDRLRVAALRTVLADDPDCDHVKASGRPTERLLRLLWALAHRDSTTLIHPSPPRALIDRTESGQLLDDGWLWACLRNAPYLDEVIPLNRARDYIPVAHWLERRMETRGVR
jgi:hypothetical protein